MKRLAFLVVLVGSLAAGCDRDTPVDLCIDGDLGRYRLESIQASGAGQAGCEATYRSLAGERARVQVGPAQPGEFADAGVPKAFEKQMVFIEKAANGARFSWYSGQVTIRVEQDGILGPEGPVLRAYLFRYPSKVIDAVQATRRDVELLRQASRKVPTDARVHLDLARNYRKLGDTVMAAQEYHIAVDVDRTCFACYLEMGTLYRELRHWDLSIRALRRAGNLRPGDPESFLLLGDVSYHVRNRLEAMRGYRQALALGLQGEKRERATSRLAELEDGKFMIQVLPGAQPKDGE